MEDTVVLHAIVKGYVQGVGFRALARHYALELGLKGTVRNLPDGSVELYAEGPKAKVHSLVEHLKNHFHIASLSEDYSGSPRSFQGFSILH